MGCPFFNENTKRCEPKVSNATWEDVYGNMTIVLQRVVELRIAEAKTLGGKEADDINKQ